MKWTKLAVAVGDVGQDPKVDDLAQSKGASYDGELIGEANTTVWGGAACSSNEAGGSSHHRSRITLDAAPTWHASYRGVRTVASIVLLVLEYRSPMARVHSRT